MIRSGKEKNFTTGTGKTRRKKEGICNKIVRIPSLSGEKVKFILSGGDAVEWP
jgi:hypothetical protein